MITTTIKEVPISYLKWDKKTPYVFLHFMVGYMSVYTLYDFSKTEEDDWYTLTTITFNDEHDTGVYATSISTESDFLDSNPILLGSYAWVHAPRDVQVISEVDFHEALMKATPTWGN